MHQEEPCHTPLTFCLDRFIIHRKIICIKIFYGEKEKEIKQSDDDTLKPIDPNHRRKAIGMVLEIPDTVEVAGY
jgi:hypothetical protein